MEGAGTGTVRAWASSVIKRRKRGIEHDPVRAHGAIGIDGPANIRSGPLGKCFPLINAKSGEPLYGAGKTADLSEGKIETGVREFETFPGRAVADEDRHAGGQCLYDRVPEVFTGGRQEKEIVSSQFGWNVMACDFAPI